MDTCNRWFNCYNTHRLVGFEEREEMKISLALNTLTILLIVINILIITFKILKLEKANAVNEDRIKSLETVHKD